MQKDFHYYATYCAAILAGYSHEESLALCYSAQFVDCCTKTLLKNVKAPVQGATTQSQGELVNTRVDLIGLQDITRIWSSFHFLPGDLHAKIPHVSYAYRCKFRLICDTNSDLLAKTVQLAKDINTIEAAGIAMHILADTWAHRYFAGTPSLVINNTDPQFFEIIEKGQETLRKRMHFNHNPASPDNPETQYYTNSVFQSDENSVMNLGHGRAGHLPDYSFIRYEYLPAWGRYRSVLKDNPNEYYHAFCQMIYALKYLKRTDQGSFLLNTYDREAASLYEDEIFRILTTRRLDSCSDWKAFGEMLSGQTIPDFSTDDYTRSYRQAPESQKQATPLGRFIMAAMAQKAMVTDAIFRSGNPLAGLSVNYKKAFIRGIREYKQLIQMLKEGNHESSSKN